ncbi:hypothetical protein ACFOVU_09390 [Nocardiopsis sediminis]|uniref:Uncharacterized protein n=1 Tax=Nocardiopsis sediminis TaxID=1778267 RepID=A0ABV8FJ22_9ACTN
MSKEPEMIEEWSRRLAAQRVKPGNGRRLKPFRWWQPTSRALFYLRLENDDAWTASAPC